jgi:hypothetical protein
VSKNWKAFETKISKQPSFIGQAYAVREKFTELCAQKFKALKNGRRRSRLNPLNGGLSSESIRILRKNEKQNWRNKNQRFHANDTRAEGSWFSPNHDVKSGKDVVS